MPTHIPCSVLAPAYYSQHFLELLPQAITLQHTRAPSCRRSAAHLTIPDVEEDSGGQRGRARERGARDCPPRGVPRVPAGLEVEACTSMRGHLA